MNQGNLLECISLGMVRRLSGRSGEQVGSHLGVSTKRISDYETSVLPAPDVLAAILKFIGQKRELYEEILSALQRAASRTNPPTATPVDPTPEEWSEMQARSITLGREAEQRALERLTEVVRARKAAEARAEAEKAVAHLESDPKPWLAVERVGEVQTWAVAERLAHRSAEVAAEDADRAMELAALAFQAAHFAPCFGPFRKRLLGYVLAFGENALRAAGDLAGAEELFAAAEESWKAGAAAPGPLEEWRLESLAGSLHRDQQELSLALARTNASLEAAPPEGRSSLLVAKALTVEKMGDTEQGLRLLLDAEDCLADPERQTLLLFIILVNRASFLCRLCRFGDAQLLLPRLSALAETLGRGLNQTRLRWLRGSVAAGLGRWEEAEALLQTARRELSYRNATFECAQVSLELLVLLCRRERTQEIRKLVFALAALPHQGKLSREARNAIHLVCNAAETSGVTPELATQAFHLLLRAPKADKKDAEASVAPAGGGKDGAGVAGAVGVQDAAAVQGVGARRSSRPKKVAGRGPDARQPGDHLVHEAGGLFGGGPPGRPGGGGRREDREENETDGETPPGGVGSNHESAPSGSEPLASSPGRAGRSFQTIQVPEAIL